MAPDYYALLGIRSDATTQEVRKAFRNLAFSCHPDIVGDDAASTELFIRIREACDVLSDPARRQQYDAERHRLHQDEQQRHARAPAVTFRRPSAKSVYSPRYTRERLRKPAEAVIIPSSNGRRAVDICGTVTLELEDTLLPASFTIYVPGTEERSSRDVLVRFPGGIYPGAVLKIPGHGLTQEGDLLIETELAPHPRLRVAAGMLFYDLRVMPWQAALGFNANVPTLEGPERIHFSPLLTTPMVKRLPQRGIYRPDGTRGDLWINQRIEVPQPRSLKARQLWADLADEHRRHRDR